MKNTIKIVTFIIILFSLSGCFNYKDINEYAIVSGISIDKDNKDSTKYKVGIQIMNAKKEEESNNSLITFYESSGKTIYEALEKIMLDSPKELYLGHNEVVVINEELLKEIDPLNYLDYFIRDSEVEKDALVMVAKDDKAMDVLKIITPLESIPSRNLKSSLDVADNFSGTLTIVTIDEFISDLLEDGKEAVIPAVTITGKVKDGEKMDNIAESNPDAKLKFSTLGYFKDNKLKGYLTSDESTGYNFLANAAKETYINVSCNDKNYATLRVSSSKLKQRFYFKDNKPYAFISIKVNADLLECDCDADFIEDEKSISKLEKKAARKVKKLITKSVNKLYKQNKADALGYGSLFYDTKSKEMKKLGYKKSDISSDISFKFKTSLEIDSTELLIKSVMRSEKNE